MLDDLKILKSKISNHCNVENIKISIFNTSNFFNISNSNKNSEIIINFGLTNNIRRINKFHESVNEILDFGNIYISCAETLEERRVRVRDKTPFGFKNIIRIVDFIYKRVIPKLPLLKKMYFSITHGHNRVMSKSEILGRLVSCGFEILEYFEEKNLLYIISRKNALPDFNMNPSYGFIFKMKRLGYKGKIIKVYKIRTMYPYSEYCQSLAIEENQLAESGKINNDFRVTTWGAFFRKFWIDELPMLINFFKRELNLVGVRPLSENYFSRYPKDLQELRIQFKPGLIPPYYADLPTNFDQILNSEREYLKRKIKSPIVTDIKYFFKSIVNIVFKGARSS